MEQWFEWNMLFNLGGTLGIGDASFSTWNPIFYNKQARGKLEIKGFAAMGREQRHHYMYTSPSCRAVCCSI